MAVRPGYYTHGGTSKTTNEKSSDYVPVDKDPFYRTTDILNGIYKKNIRLESGSTNQTDGKKIWVNFGETMPSPVIKDLGLVGASNNLYLLECGHKWEAKPGYPIDGTAMGSCQTCGGNQSYLGFEHEWQHIIFKSDLAVRQLFVEAYAKTLQQNAPEIDLLQLQGFLSLVVNAFDDVRCNSLWEKVYPGSAGQIWERWERLTRSIGNGVNSNFLAYMFAVAFGIPTDPKGEFEPLRPVLEWGMTKVRYRGFGNMLVEVRAVLDRCMGTLLDKMKKRGQENGNQGQQAQDQHSNDPSSGSGTKPPGHNSENNDSAEQAEGTDGDPNVAEDSSEVDPPVSSPSMAQLQPTPKEQSAVMTKIMDGATKIDPSEEHLPPSADQLAEAKKSQTSTAVLNKALRADIQDIEALDMSLPDHPDSDMQQALDQLRDGMNVKSADSLLTGDAKARIVLIDVTREGVPDDSQVMLTTEEDIAVKRMRSTFFRSLGRQKARRSIEGSIIDVQALTAYRLERQDPEVFENESVQQGFSYSILCDMSGSMAGTFSSVCHAVEMLKQALHFPFVNGDLWGFRGGELTYQQRYGTPQRMSGNSEVWLYRYHKDVKGYTGTAYVRGNRYPVCCNGLTPMNPAINVAVNHLRRDMPEGMAKRLFILTDGSPCYSRVSGAGLPTWMLRKFVAKEINTGRKHGIQVYTLVLANDREISDKDCKDMFGPTKFWRRVAAKHNTSEVGKTLSSLVLDNFQRYIRNRG
jgi:hypothetical protein